MIFTTCSRCGHPLEFNEDLVNTKQICKYCGKDLIVPEKRKFQLRRPKVTANGDVIIPFSQMTENETAEGDAIDMTSQQTNPQVVDADDDSWFTQRERNAKTVSENKRTFAFTRLFVRLLDLSLETGILFGLAWLLLKYKVLPIGGPYDAESPVVWLACFLFSILSLAFLLDSIVYFVFKTTFARCLFSVFILREEGKQLSRVGYLVRNILVYFTGFGVIVLAPVCLIWQGIRILCRKGTFYDDLLKLKVQSMPRSLGTSIKTWCVGILLFLAGTVGTWFIASNFFSDIEPVEMYALGWDYEFGNNGREMNLKKAFACFWLAAQSKDADALYRMGLFYDDGIAVARSAKKALECWKKAAELGCNEADLMLDAVECERRLECGEMLSNLGMIRVNPGSAYTEIGTVSVDYPYWISSMEITWGIWDSVMSKRGSGIEDDNSIKYKPINNISWKSAKLFCKRLNLIYENVLPGGYQFSLPSKNEWIFATKGGRKANTAGFAFDDDVVWHAGNANGAAHDAGEKSANPLGLYDTCGNVWEWLDFGVDDDALFTIGGSWMDPLEVCRPTERREQESNYAGPDTGLRIVLTPR